MLARMWKKREPFCTCWWEYKLVQPLWKTVAQKIKNRTGIPSSNPTSDNLTEEHNTNFKRYMHPIFTAALFTLTKIWKQPRCPSTDEWKKKIHTHTHTDYSALKKNEIDRKQQNSVKQLSFSKK